MRWDKHTTWFVQSWKGLELKTYNNNLDSPFQTLWMEIQFAKKTSAVNFVKSCINYINLLSTSKITLMKPLRNKSLPIHQIILWITLTKTFPKLTPVHTCWYVKDFLFSSHFLYSNGHRHTFRVTLADNYCKGSCLILNCQRLPNLHFFFQSVCRCNVVSLMKVEGWETQKQ